MMILRAAHKHTNTHNAAEQLLRVQGHRSSQSRCCWWCSGHRSITSDQLWNPCHSIPKLITDTTMAKQTISALSRSLLATAGSALLLLLSSTQHIASPTFSFMRPSFLPSRPNEQHFLLLTSVNATLSLSQERGSLFDTWHSSLSSKIVIGKLFARNYWEILPIHLNTWHAFPWNSKF